MNCLYYLGHMCTAFSFYVVIDYAGTSALMVICWVFGAFICTFTQGILERVYKVEKRRQLMVMFFMTLISYSVALGLEFYLAFDVSSVPSEDSIPVHYLVSILAFSTGLQTISIRASIANCTFANRY